MSIIHRIKVTMPPAWADDFHLEWFVRAAAVAESLGYTLNPDPRIPPVPAYRLRIWWAQNLDPRPHAAEYLWWRQYAATGVRPMRLGRRTA